MRIITKRSRWGHREFTAINRWPGPRWSRHQQTCGTVSARVGHSKRIHLSELSSFRTIEGVCSRLLPSHAVLGEWSPPRSPSTHLCTDRGLLGKSRRPARPFQWTALALAPAVHSRYGKGGAVPSGPVKGNGAGAGSGWGRVAAGLSPPLALNTVYLGPGPGIALPGFFV